MHVSKTPISKANVCKYRGDEIPGYETLGLDANKWYNVYRDPEELAKAASTFNNKPLLNTHLPFSIVSPPKDAIVGMTGDDAVFDFPYLYNSMTIYDGNQQAGIESGQHREISSSYYWTPVLKSGISPEGDEYDIVMTDLVCNHVAIVPDGRAGSDVLVYDSKPKGYKIMSKLKKRIWDAVKGKLASDANPDDLKEELEGMVDDEEQTEADRDNESEAERLKRREKREDKDREKDKRADDADEDEDDKKSEKKSDKKAEDEDADEKVKMACDALRAEFKELREAERICAPHVGSLACDSAEELYRATLKHAGVSGYDTVPAAALKPMVGMLKGQSLANDAAPAHVTRDSRAAVMKMIRGE